MYGMVIERERGLDLKKGVCEQAREVSSVKRIQTTQQNKQL